MDQKYRGLGATPELGSWEVNSESSQAGCDAACHSCRWAGLSIKERQEQVCAE